MSEKLNELRELIQKLDQDYLIGLSNKGIVKRAAKDLEGVSPTVSIIEDGVKIILDDAECTYIMPPSSFSCTCPSRNVCRHLIAGLLYLMAHPEIIGAETEEGLPPQKTEMKESEKEKDPEEDSSQQSLEGNDRHPEILHFPLEKIRKCMKKRQYQEFLVEAEKGKFPEIIDSSIITVRLPKENITVKLLEPLENSTCTCHKKELCEHKAEAILWYQIKAGKVSLEDLQEPKQQDLQILEEWREVGQKIQTFLADTLQNGLVRESTEEADSCDQMALLCHNRNLPALELEFRGLAEDYRQYLQRSNQFQMRAWLARFCRMYEDAEILRNGTYRQISEIAGEYKAAYHDAEKMVLYAVAQQKFLTKSGYDGITTWFLRVPEMDWYTFTHAVPVFYEDSGQSARHAEKFVAPWGLGCSLEDLPGTEIFLANPKISEEHRISSSESIKGQIVRSRQIYSLAENGSSYPYFYSNFAKMAEDCLLSSSFGENDAKIPARELVFVCAARADSQTYDSVRQCYQRRLFDTAGRSVLVELPFTKKNEKNIDILEYYGKKQEIPVYFGFLTLNEGWMKLEPLEVFPRPDAMPPEDPEPETQESWTPEALCLHMDEILKESQQTLESLMMTGGAGMMKPQQEEFLRQSYILEKAGMAHTARRVKELSECSAKQWSTLEKNGEVLLKSWISCYTYLQRCRTGLERELLKSRLREETEKNAEKEN